jgi:hypothetical protein
MNGYYLSSQIFQKDHGKFVGDSVHEKVKINRKEKHIKGDILHYAGESPVEFIQKNILYADLTAHDLFEYRNKISPLKTAIKTQ